MGEGEATHPPAAKSTAGLLLGSQGTSRGIEGRSLKDIRRRGGCTKVSNRINFSAGISGCCSNSRMGSSSELCTCESRRATAQRKNSPQPVHRSPAIGKNLVSTRSEEGDGGKKMNRSKGGKGTVSTASKCKEGSKKGGRQGGVGNVVVFGRLRGLSSSMARNRLEPNRSEEGKARLSKRGLCSPRREGG